MAADDARDYVLAFENHKSEAVLIAKNTSEKLQNKETSLIQVVQALGEYINDDDEKIRARAVHYLTAVITALPEKFLTRQQIQVLNDFLCDRIEDGGALEGLSRLQALDRYTADMTQTLLRAIFTHFADLRSRPQSARYKVLTLVNDLLTRHRKAVRDLQDESLTGIVELVAGEKDPRNLMLVFSMLRVLMVEWDIDSHTDILFDAVYAYFPITFRPPPNDPYGITAQDLKNRLRDCIASNGTLAPHAFPNLLDRLDSTSDTVKKDVLQALATCAQNYGVATMNQYSITLWDAVKFEVLQAQEPFLADEALAVLKALATCLSRSANHSPTSSPLIQYLKPVNKECLEHLQEPASRQAKASGDILKAVASASESSFEAVLKTVGPALFTLQQAAEGIVSQRAVLETTNKLFEAGIEVYGSWLMTSDKSVDGHEPLLHEFKDRLVAIYSQALMGTVKEEVSFRLTGAKGLLLLAQMRGLLADNEIGLFVQYFDDIVLDGESYGRDELKRTAMKALSDISKFKPRLITDITFPAFLARLPASEDDASLAKEYSSVLEGLVEISTGRELLATLMRRLLNRLDILVQPKDRVEYPYTCAVLSTIYYGLNRSTKESGTFLDDYYDKILGDLVRRSTAATSGPLTNARVLDLIGRVANLVTRHSQPVRQLRTAENVYLLFRDRATLSQESSQSVFFEPPSSIIVSTWLLAALPRDMTTDLLSPATVIHNIGTLVEYATSCSQPSILFSCLKQIALYTNKHLPLSLVSSVESIMTTSFGTLKTSSNPSQIEFLLRLVFTLSRALTLRLAPHTNAYLSDLVGLLGDPEYNRQVACAAAVGFSTVLASDDILSKTNFAQIRLLATQKVVQTLTPLISDGFRATTSASSKENYLTALAGVLNTVSSVIMMAELPTLLPLLLQSLDLTDQSVKIATLDTLAVVITSNPHALVDSGHLDALVKRLLGNASLPKATMVDRINTATANETSSPRVRRMATKCLALMPKYLTDTGNSGTNPLLQLKKPVLQGLTAPLDDPRRDVRKEAVDARAAWSRGVDDVDSDEDD